MRGFYSLVPLCPRAVCPLEKLGFDKWPLKEKSGGDYWVSLVSGVSSCVCTVSSGWQGHWYSLRTSAEAFLGPPATALNLVLILGAWWSCLFWWAASRVRRNALCWTEGCWAVNTPHTCMRTSKKNQTHTHIEAHAQRTTAAGSKVSGWFVNLNKSDDMEVKYFPLDGLFTLTLFTPSSNSFFKLVVLSWLIASRLAIVRQKSFLHHLTLVYDRIKRKGWNRIYIIKYMSRCWRLSDNLFYVDMKRGQNIYTVKGGSFDFFFYLKCFTYYHVKKKRDDIHSSSNNNIFFYFITFKSNNFFFQCGDHLTLEHKFHCLLIFFL